MFKKLMYTTVITLATLILTVVMGCSTVLDAFTPCYIPPQLVELGGEELWSPVPYTTLWDAQRVLRKVNYLTEGLAIGMAGARELQANLFDPTSPLGLLMVGAPSFTLGSLLISKPKDKKKIVELENGNGKTQS
jgi:hypothetical protein